MEQPLPPRIQAIADGLRDELLIHEFNDVVLIDLTVATAIRIELHLLDPAARDPKDKKWDQELDRLYRRYLRCLTTLRNPRRPSARSNQATSTTPGAGGVADALGTRAAEGKTSAASSKPAVNVRHTLAPITQPTESTQDHSTATRPAQPTADTMKVTDPADSPVNQLDLAPGDEPTKTKRRPDPAKLLRQSRQERRRQARQRKHATPRASPAT